jgi:hypothetical protein
MRRKSRREVVMGSTLISILEGPWSRRGVREWNFDDRRRSPSALVPLPPALLDRTEAPDDDRKLHRRYRCPNVSRVLNFSNLHERVGP